MKKSLVFVFAFVALAGVVLMAGCNGNAAEAPAHKKMVAEADSLLKAYALKDSVYQQLTASHEATMAPKDGDTVAVDSAVVAAEAQHAELIKAHAAMLDAHKAMIAAHDALEKKHAEGKMTAEDLAKDHDQIKADFVTIMADYEKMEKELNEMLIFHEHFHKE